LYESSKKGDENMKKPETSHRFSHTSVLRGFSFLSLEASFSLLLNTEVGGLRETMQMLDAWNLNNG
jgi:hypothetical protein